MQQKKLLLILLFFIVSHYSNAQQDTHPVCSETPCNTSDAEIDIIVVYTPNAFASPYFGNVSFSTANEKINGLIDEFNTICSSSGINPRLNLVYSDIFLYTESNDVSQDVSNISALIKAQELRDCYGADLFSIIVESPNPNLGLGAASPPPRVSTGFDDNSAFSVIDVRGTDSTYTFTHEIGHNLGLMHDKNTLGLCAASDYSPDDALCSDMFGYVSTDRLSCNSSSNNYFRTIMGKSSQDNTTCNYCEHSTPRIPYWSDPNIPYGTENEAIGNIEANAAAALSKSACYVSQYRERNPQEYIASFYLPIIGDAYSITTTQTISANLACYLGVNNFASNSAEERSSNTSATNTGTNVNIDYYVGNTFHSNIVSNHPVNNDNTITYPWDISNNTTTGTENAKIRITDASDPTLYSESDLFTLIAYDYCNSAIPIPVQSNPCSYSEEFYLFSSTNDDGNPTCGAPLFSGDVWAEVTVPTSGNIGINVTDGVFDAAFAVYTDCNNIAGSEIFCDDEPFLNYEGFGLTAGSTLYVRVWAASDTSGDSNPIVSVCAYEPDAPAPPTACDPPTGISSVTNGAAFAIIQWNVVSNAYSYNLRYRPTSGGSWTTITSFIGGGNNCSGNECQYSLQNLNESTSYEIQLQTECLGGDDSAWSSSSFFSTISNNANSFCTSPEYNALSGSFDDGSGYQNSFPDGQFFCPYYLYPQCPNGEVPTQITIQFDYFEVINYNDDFGPHRIGQRLIILNAANQQVGAYTQSLGLPVGTAYPAPSTPLTYNTGGLKLYFESIDNLPGGTNDGWEIDYFCVCPCTLPATPTVSAMDAIVCSDIFDEVTLTASASPDTDYIHQWQLNGVDIVDANEETLTVSQAGDYSVYLTDLSGCNSTTSTNFTVTDEMCINPCEVFDVSVSSQDASCEDSNGAASLSITGGTTPYTIAWNDGVNTASRGDLTPNISYTVTVTDANNCSQPKSVMTSNVGTDPTANFTLSENDLTVTLSNSSSNTNSFEFNFGDGTSSTSSNPSHTYSSPGTYSICINAQNSCGNDIHCQVVTLSSVLPVDLVRFDVEGDTKNSSITWQSLSENYFSHYEIEFSLNRTDWNRLHVEEPNLDMSYGYTHENAYITAKNAVIYYRLKMVDLDNSFKYSEVRSVDFTNSEKAIQVFPNPVRDAVFFTMADAETISFELYNVHQQRINLSQKSFISEASISLSDLPSGVYHLVFYKQGVIVQTERLVVY